MDTESNATVEMKSIKKCDYCGLLWIKNCDTESNKFLLIDIFQHNNDDLLLKDKMSGKN